MATTPVEPKPDVIVDYAPAHYRPKPVLMPSPVIVNSSPSDCNCHSGSGFEQKIKENPLLFVLGALALGYFLAKQ